MRFTKMLVAGLALWFAVASEAQTPSYKNIGRTPTKEEIAAWDISIRADGKNLPAGKGTAKEGAPIYAAQCAVCHGANAEGGKIGPQMATGKAELDSLTTMKPVRFVGNYWPTAPMVWDYINRGMPRNKGGTLSADEVYALTAFILFKSGIIKEEEVMDAATLAKVQMPNRNGFVPPSYADVANLKKRGCKQGICP